MLNVRYNPKNNVLKTETDAAIVERFTQKDIWWWSIECKEQNTINLFADDTLLIIKEPLQSKERIRTHLMLFEKATGLRINWDKSERMLLKHKTEELTKWNPNLGVKVNNSIKYLP